MMRFIDLGIGVQPRVVHDTVNKVIHDGRDRIDTPKSIIERGLGIWLILACTLLRHVTSGCCWPIPKRTLLLADIKPAL